MDVHVTLPLGATLSVRSAIDAPSSSAESKVMVCPAMLSLLETVQCTVQVLPVMQDVWPSTMGWWAEATPAHRPTEPMTAAITAAMKMKMRPDLVTDGDKPDAVVANAPDREESFFVVPKVVE